VRAARRPLVVALLALVTFLVTGALGALVVRADGPTYRSTAVLSIDQPSVLSRSAQPGPVLKLQILRAQYAALLGTRLLLDPIAERVDRPAGEVQEALRGVAAKNSLLVVITGEGDDAAEARALAEAASDELITYVTRSQDESFVKKDDQVALQLLSPARPGVVVTGARRTVVTTGLFVGLVCAAGVVAMATWVRNPER
jgi:capsular polysaccharide biosynthesis protein